MPRSAAPWLALACALALAACGTDAVEDPDTGGGGPLDVVVQTDRSSYEAGARPELTLTLRNTGDRPVTLDFASGQRYDFRVDDASGRSAWTWSATRTFIQALGSETLEPGEERSWTATVEPPLDAGDYTAVGMVTNRRGPLVDRSGFAVR